MKSIKLHKIGSQLENPGHVAIIPRKLSFMEEGTAFIWKLSLASGSTGICLRKIDHSEYRVQLSQGRPNYHLVMIMRKKRFHRLNEAKRLSGSNFLQLHLYSPRSAVSSSVRAAFHPKHTYAVPKMSEASFQHT